jgi:hypothetical protein
MYRNAILIEIIKRYVGKLNTDWMTKKEAEFRRHEDYNHEQGQICVVDRRVYPNYGENEEILDDEIVENLYEFSFSHYCACYLPICDYTGWGTFPLEYSREYLYESNNIDRVAGKLVGEIANYIEDEADVIIVHKFISKQIKDIEAEVKRKKKILDNELYGNVLDEFTRLCAYGLNRKFKKQLIRYDETVDFIGGLEFSLNQGELLSLLFLIERAGFLMYPNHRELLEFCHNHFLYKNEDGESVRPTSLKALQKKYSDINSSQAPNSKQDLVVNGLSTVSNKLSDVIKKLR